MNSIAHGPRPAVNISDKLNNIITYMGIKLLFNSTNRGFEICIYRRRGEFYRPNSFTIFNSILSSTVTPTKLELVKNSTIQFRYPVVISVK